MNYLAHGYRFLDDPLFLAGTAVPDWLSVVNRRVRVRRRLVEPVVAATQDDHLRRIGRGILQHHHDDDLFHRCEVFQRLEAEFSAAFRRHMPDRYDHRPAFLGHILVELLLDATLAERDPTLLNRFYAAMARVNAQLVEDAVNHMAARSTDQLAWFIERFRQERFLEDYANNTTLALRLNQVLKRVRLEPMSDQVMDVLEFARRRLHSTADLLLSAVESVQRPS
ncbi:MAG: hypothetical protein R3C59_27560 [Planctomycetaceae bacterium]